MPHDGTGVFTPPTVGDLSNVPRELRTVSSACMWDTRDYFTHWADSGYTVWPAKCMESSWYRQQDSDGTTTSTV